jgi:hypothetical protein
MSWYDNLTKRVSDAGLGEDKEGGGSSETAVELLTERRCTAPLFWLRSMCARRGMRWTGSGIWRRRMWRSAP